jgi:hypothetical protein
MYKVASDRRQSALHRGRMSDWVNGEEFLKAEDRLRQLQCGYKILVDRIVALPKGSVERKKLGHEQKLLEAEITKLKALTPPIKHASRGIADVFIDMAREILSEAQFKLVWNTAIREQELRQKAAEKAAAAIAAYSSGERTE